MKGLVLDASIALGWMVDAPAPPVSLRALHPLQWGTMGIVPDLWYYEVSNALITAECRRQASAQVVSSHLGDIERIAAFLEASPTAPSALIAASRQSGPMAYHAAYFELALRRNLPLATLDDRMRAAAHGVGIELLRRLPVYWQRGACKGSALNAGVLGNADCPKRDGGGSSCAVHAGPAAISGTHPRATCAAAGTTPKPPFRTTWMRWNSPSPV